MSTPIASLPKTADNKKQDRNDINDPIVQDVLNEFRDEYSSNNKNNGGEGGMLHDIDDMVSFPPEDNYPPPPMNYRKPQYNIRENYQNYNQYQNDNQYHNDRNDNQQYLNFDIELIKKNLTIVIIVLLIHNTGLMTFLYEKMPEYLHENLNTYDIVFKSMLLFIILYVLNIMQYI
jgi:hypothetical protein